MPDFSAAFTAGATGAVWTDPPSVDGLRPSRINPFPDRPHRRRVAQVGATVELTMRCANLAGDFVAGLPDSELGGRTFIGWIAEKPLDVYPWTLVHTDGWTSVQRFTPRTPGHYTIAIRRNGGGAVFLHLDVEAS